MKSGKESFFWTSYSDLMTSLFFIMLVLFILMLVFLRNSVVKAQIAERASKEQLAKIKEIEEAVNTIDTKWFQYNEEHKKHILKIAVAFKTGSSDISDIPMATLDDLYSAGQSIIQFLERAYDKYKVKYLLIIEGQASKDNYMRNYELSYERALSLVKFWTQRGLTFNPDYCEVIISGSGQSGSLRMQPDNAVNVMNQRFLIHIVPKPGMIDVSKNRDEE